MQILLVGRFPVWMRDLWKGLHNAVRVLFCFSLIAHDFHRSFGCVETWGSVGRATRLGNVLWILHPSQLGPATYLDRNPPVCHPLSASLEVVYWISDKCCSVRKSMVAKLRVLLTLPLVRLSSASRRLAVLTSWSLWGGGWWLNWISAAPLAWSGA